MSLERDLKKAGIVLPPDSHWRRNFLVKGTDPLVAQFRSNIYTNLFVASVIGIFAWLFGNLIFLPIADIPLIVGVTTILGAAMVMFANSMSYYSHPNDLESTVKKVADHLSISAVDVLAWDLSVIKHAAESHLKTVATELDKLRRDNDLDPLSIELPALQAKFKRAFDDFKLARLIPEDATYVRYFPAPAGKK